MNSEFRVLCPYCDKPYTDEMTKQLVAAGLCETCGTGLTPETKYIDIKCGNCNKIIYRKEINN